MQESIVAAAVSNNQRSSRHYAAYKAVAVVDSCSHSHHDDDDDDDEMPKPSLSSSYARRTKIQAHVTAEWNMMAGEWDDIAKGYRNRFVPLLSKMVDLKGKVVVDFGCGTGMLTEYIRRYAAHVICIDASPRMIHLVQDKSKAQEWTNVEAHCTVLSDAERMDGAARRIVQLWIGKVDVVIASLVLSHLPTDDVALTMSAIGKFLRPGGVFVHSDWEKTEELGRFPDGFTKERALNVYTMANLEAQDMKAMVAKVGGEDVSVLVGVSVKANP